MHNSHDPQTRLNQAKLRSYGKQKAYRPQFEKMSLEELVELQKKGEAWISKHMWDFSDPQINTDSTFEKQFDEVVLKYETIEDLIYLKTNS